MRVSTINETLIKAILKSYQWSKEILSGTILISDIVKRENQTERYVSRILQLSFLSPKIISEIFEGRQSKYISLQKLKKIKELNWKRQDAKITLHNLLDIPDQI